QGSRHRFKLDNGAKDRLLFRGGHDMQSAAAYAGGEDVTPGLLIGAVRGATTADIQKLLAAFAERRRRDGCRVAGAMEWPATVGACLCGPLALKDLASGALFPVTLNLGPGSSACRLDAAGLAEACQSVLRAISQEADLVVLSKFGKVETEGSGFLDAFNAA